MPIPTQIPRNRVLRPKLMWRLPKSCLSLSCYKNRRQCQHKSKLIIRKTPKPSQCSVVLQFRSGSLRFPNFSLTSNLRSPSKNSWIDNLSLTLTATRASSVVYLCAWLYTLRGQARALTSQPSTQDHTTQLLTLWTSPSLRSSWGKWLNSYRIMLCFRDTPIMETRGVYGLRCRSKARSPI